MKYNHKSSPASVKSQGSVIVFPADMSRRLGNMRSVTLNNKSINADRLFGATKNSQVLVEGVFGKSLRDAQPETGVQ